MNSRNNFDIFTRMTIWSFGLDYSVISLTTMPKLSTSPIFLAIVMSFALHFYFLWKINLPHPIEKQTLSSSHQLHLTVRLIPQFDDNLNLKDISHILPSTNLSTHPYDDLTIKKETPPPSTFPTEWSPSTSNYYPSHELTIKPKIIQEADLESAETRDIPAYGKIEASLFIDEFGNVSFVKIESTELPDIFSNAVTDGFKKSHFSPGEINGVAVKSVLRIELTYADKF